MQQSGGSAPAEAFRTGPGSDRLLLASHNRLLWYYYNSGKVDVLHEGQVLREASSARCTRLLLCISMYGDATQGRCSSSRPS